MTLEEALFEIRNEASISNEALEIVADCDDLITMVSKELPTIGMVLSNYLIVEQFRAKLMLKAREI